MKKYILPLVFIIFSLNIHAQYEANTWYFGKNVGMDFSELKSYESTIGTIHNLPTVIKNTPISTGEGCFTMSDVDGNLLFSSDGSIIYNKNNVKMLNGDGLKGDASSAQSGIVVPHPGFADKYYVVTAPVVGDKVNGYRYSIVDMKADNNLGAVVLADKNKPLSTNAGSVVYNATHTSENIIAVKHSNERDYWLVARVWKHFLVWPVTHLGIGSPKAYEIKPSPANAGYDLATRNQSQIRISPDGKKLVVTSNQKPNLGLIYHADFDPGFGTVKNALCTSTGMGSTYSVEFSPNGEYIYMTRIEYPAYNSGENIQTGLFVRKTSDLGKTQANINDNRIIAEMSAVQLGPDKRIYAVCGGWQKLGARKGSLWVIMNPDEGGTEIAEIKNYFPYVSSGVHSPSSDKGCPVYGLPPFMTSYFSLKGIHGEVYPCVRDEYQFEAYLAQGTDIYEIKKIVWNFGDGSPEIEQVYQHGISTYPVKHTYRDIKEYEMTATPYNIYGDKIDSSVLKKKIRTRHGSLIINTGINLQYYE